MNKHTVPTGLSPWAIDAWQQLHELHDFAVHEDLVFQRALRWWDESDRLQAAGQMKLAMDASSAALRHWRTLKFAARTETRRPGRPSDDHWSAKRKAAAGLTALVK